MFSRGIGDVAAQKIEGAKVGHASWEIRHMGSFSYLQSCHRAWRHADMLEGFCGYPAGIRLSEAPIDNLLWRCLDKYEATSAEASKAFFLTCHDLCTGGTCVRVSLLMPCLVCSTYWALLVQRAGPLILAKVRMAAGFSPLRV